MRKLLGGLLVATAFTLFGLAIGSTVASAVDDPYDPNYWEAQLPHEADCFGHGATSQTPHGSVNGNIATLGAFQDAWEQDHWEAIIVGAGGQFKLYLHPTAGVGYTAPLVGETAPAIDKWFACKGYDPEVVDTTAPTTPTTLATTTTAAIVVETTTTTAATSVSTAATTTTTTDAPQIGLGSAVPTTTPGLVELPRTGRNTDLLLLAGTLTAAAGVSLLIVRRRPESANAD